VSARPISFEHYWWRVAAPEPAAPAALAQHYDVAIVGSGYTGLRAAIELLRAGRSVVVLEREDPGFGASRRNAGYLGRGLKKAFPKLREKYGATYARAAYAEAGEAFRSTLEFIEKEGIDCRLQRCGRYIAASSAQHYEELAGEMEVMKREFGYEFSLVPRSRQREEFASDAYHGGAVLTALGSLHPGLYHKGLLALVLRLGGAVSGRTEVTGIESGKDSVSLSTGRGSIRAGEAIIATNGYTPPGFAWHARRLIPFTAYMAATEPLPDERFASLIPAGRTVLDTNFNIDFFRPAPDSNRILFGGATGSGLSDNRAIAARLKRILASILPSSAMSHSTMSGPANAPAPSTICRIWDEAIGSGTRLATISAGWRWAAISVPGSRAGSWIPPKGNRFSSSTRFRPCRSIAASRGSCRWP